MAAAGGTNIIATFPGPPAVHITVPQVQAAMAAAGLARSGPAARAAVATLLPNSKDVLLTVLPAALLAGKGLKAKKVLTKALCTTILEAAGYPRQLSGPERAALAAAVDASVAEKLSGWLADA